MEYMPTIRWAHIAATFRANWRTDEHGFIADDVERCYPLEEGDWGRIG